MTRLLGCTALSLTTACTTVLRAAPGPDHAAVVVKVANTGFERALAGWSVGRFGKRVSVDAGVARSGGASVRVHDPEGADMPYLAQAVEGLQGGATYALRAWVRGEEQAAGAAAALKIEGYTADGRNTLGKYKRLSLRKAGDWTRLELVAEFPPEITRASLLLRLFGAGTVWFDDVEFAQTVPPPLLTLSPKRQVVQAEQRQVDLTARLASAHAESPPPIQITIRDEQRGVVESRAALDRVEAGIWRITLAVPVLPAGTYAVESRLGEAEGAGAHLFVPLSSRKPANLTETGTILVGGQPYFPIGVYHCSPAHYPLLAEAGFNCVQGKGPGDLDAFGKSLDAAAAAGLTVDVPLYARGEVAANMPESLAGIARFADHPAVMCWKIIDEPDLREKIVDDVPAAYAALRAADPAHPIELTLCMPPRFGEWVPFCDLMQVDPYPIPREPLTMVSDWVSKARACLEPWQNLTAVLQAGWTQHPLNQPTREQARCMVYLALIHGAKGIFWYSFRDPGWQLEKTPLWEHFPAINAETLALSRPVMLGREAPSVRVESPGDRVHWRAWRHEEETWLLLANPGETAQTVAVETGAPCTVHDVGGRKVASSDGAFEVALPATGAEVRRLRTERRLR